MDEKKFTCIVCPISCQVSLKVEKDEKIEIRGASCKRGEIFALNEYKNPVRTLTTIVTLENSRHSYLPVISDGNIPKNQIVDCLNILKNTKIKAPITMGDIVIQDILSTGINIVSAKTV